MNLKRYEQKIELISLVKKFLLAALMICTTQGLYAQCYENEGLAFSINASGGNQDTDYATRYILSDYLGTIVEISSTPTFSGKDAGLYKAYAINYDLSEAPTNLQIGVNVKDLESDCIDVSESIDINICRSACDIFDGNYSFTAQGGNNNLVTNYLLVDEFLDIVDISASPSFSNIGSGDYLVFAINYESVDNLSVGVSINSLTGSCFDLSNPISISSCSNCTIHIGEDFEICEGLETLLTSSASSSGGSYLWSTGATTPNIMITASATTEYSVTFTDNSGCVISDSLLITVLDPPMGNIVGDNFICQGESSTLTASGGSSYMWIEGSSASEALITVSPNVTTEYTVLVFNDNLCVDTVSTTVLVEDCNLDCGYCVGDTLNFSVSGGNTDLSNIFVLTGLDNIIVDTNSDPEFELATAGEYKIFPINYDESNPPLAGLDIGSNINDVTGICFDIGAPFIARACECGAIGDYVWLDENMDGGQDNDEIGINGVIVNLYDANNPTFPIATTVTMQNPDNTQLTGYYIFDELLPGNYYVEFVTPDGLEITIPNSSDGEGSDSDLDGSNGEGTTATIQLMAGEVNLDIDAGFILPVLPVDWLYIEGEWNRTRDVNEVTWGTATEINSSHFIVERSYMNEGFVAVGKVDAQGLSHETSAYEFNDFDIERSGNYYYRLKQVDLDGSFEYSRTIAIVVKRKEDFSVEVYPNPVYDEFTISITSNNQADVQAMLLDLTGKLVMNNNYSNEIQQGKSEIRFLLDDIPTGTYLLRITSETNVVVKKIMVTK